MYYTIFIILITVLTIILTLSKNKKISKFRKKKSDFFNFFLTLVATFIGVFVAIYFTNQAEIKKDKKEVVKYLSATMIDLNQEIASVKSIINIVERNKSNTAFSYRRHVDMNPINLPSLFISIYENDMIMRHFSTLGLENYAFCNQSLKKMNKAFNERKIGNDSIESREVIGYSKMLHFALNIAGTERAILEGTFKESELPDTYWGMRQRLYGFNEKQIDSLYKIKRPLSKNNNYIKL